MWPTSAHDCWQVTEAGQLLLLRISPSHNLPKSILPKSTLAAAHVGVAGLFANGPTTSVHESEHGAGGEAVTPALQVSQSSIAFSNSPMAYIHTCMYAVPFFTASMRAAAPSVAKLFGPCLPLVKTMFSPLSAADTHLSA